MFHLDNNSGVSAMPPVGALQSSSPRWFTEGGGGVPASYPGAAWFNILQAELLNVLSAYGVTPDKAKLDQLKTAIETAVSQRASLASPAFTGIPTAPTAGQSVNNTQIATTAFVKAALAALVDSSPAALDTLNELAAALGNDPNFATTMMNALANKQAKDSTLTALSGKDVAGLLTYLGLGTAAKKDVGTSTSQLPDMSSFSYVNDGGSAYGIKFPSLNAGGAVMMQTAQVNLPVGITDVTLPYAVPNAVISVVTSICNGQNQPSNGTVFAAIITEASKIRFINWGTLGITVQYQAWCR